MGPGTDPLYPTVFTIFPGAISRDTGAMRSVGDKKGGNGRPSAALVPIPRLRPSRESCSERGVDSPAGELLRERPSIPDKRPPEERVWQPSLTATRPSHLGRNYSRASP